MWIRVKNRSGGGLIQSLLLGLTFIPSACTIAERSSHPAADVRSF